MYTDLITTRKIVNVTMALLSIGKIQDFYVWNVIISAIVFTLIAFIAFGFKR